MSCKCDCHFTGMVHEGSYNRLTGEYTPAKFHYDAGRCGKCERHHLTYNELQERGNKVLEYKLAPPDSYPKNSRGDYPKARRIRKAMLSKDTISMKDLKFTGKKIKKK